MLLLLPIAVVLERFGRGSVVAKERNSGHNRFPTTALGNDKGNFWGLSLPVAVILESRSPGSVVIKKRGKQRILDRNLPE